MRTNIFLCVICIVVAFAFAWWISCEVVSDIEAKDSIMRGHEHSWKRGVSQDKYKVWSGENPAQCPTYFSECRTCGEITTDPDTYYTAQAKDIELVHLVSLCYDPNEPFLTTALVHEQEVEIIEPNEPITYHFSSRLAPVVFWQGDDGEVVEYVPIGSEKYKIEIKSDGKMRLLIQSDSPMEIIE